jgi:hypothetical protein
MQKYTKQQRKDWWNSLSPQQQADYRRKKMSENSVVTRMKESILPLTKDEMKFINDTMRKIGLENQIVLPD